jgi:hypothetical protein
MRRTFLICITMLICALAVASCGTQGYAPPLGKPAHVALGSAGSATLTPMHALRVVAYYKGKQLPATGAATPAELHRDSCSGPFVAALTDGAPAAGAHAAAPTMPDPDGGLDVAVDPGAQWYVVVYDRANDPHAQVVACGHPLSGRQQYFDLYTAAKGSNGIALGTVLVSPITATRIDVSLTAGASASQSTWAVHAAHCDGVALAQGTIVPGGTTGAAVVFATPGATPWWVTLAPVGGAPVCAEVHA